MSNSRHIHIIGAGMAGLSAALQLTLMGEQVTVYEAAPFAGGRCRSYLDQDLDCRIDNGNHLVLSGNAADSMNHPAEAVFPFMDLQSGERWIARLNDGRLPWWILDKNRRVAGTKLIDYLSAVKILTARPGATVAARLDTQNALYRRFWEPLTIGALNTEPEIASAQLLANVVRQTFSAGGKACYPLIPKIGLSESFVMPCLNVLRQRNAEVKYNRRLRAVQTSNDAYPKTTIRELQFSNGETIELMPGDWVVIALPAWMVKELLPELMAPNEFRSIINAHFRLEAPGNAAGLTGLVGGVAEWVFVKNGVVSVTISCAERYIDHAVRDLAPYVWQDVAKLYDLDPKKIPPYKIIKEKYATFAATPAQNARRPRAFDFRWRNMALAGEWTATGLPSTIEGAIRSGMKAAQVVMRWAE